MRSIVFFTRALLATGLALTFGRADFARAADAPAWPQAKSDIPVDPAIRFGALPNGMRYAIWKNTTPKGEVSMRLRIGAGSLQESDAQQGLAHFLDHMAFRGSVHVPEGDVFQILQRLGLRVGADANASTGPTETIYQWDLPKADKPTLDTAFMLARDIVSELNLKPEAFEAERGPVLSEERLRASPGFRAFEAQNKFVLKAQLAPDRMPIGKVEVIRNAPVSQVADFYRDYYRPERTALVVVGDIDPDAIESEIKTRFSDWNPSGTGRPDPDLGTAASTCISVSWISPYDNSPDTAENRKRDRIEGIGLAILNQRFAQVAQNADAPFQAAGAGVGNTTRSAKIASLRIGYSGDKWQRALEDADNIRRQVLAQGVTQQEVDRQVTTSLTGAQANVAGSATRVSRNLAQGLVGAIDRDDVFNSPATGLAMTEAQLKGVTADQVNAALRTIFVGNGPLLFLSSPKPVEGGEAKLASVFKGAEAATMQNTAPPDLVVWPYTNFGTPGLSKISMQP